MRTSYEVRGGNRVLLRLVLGVAFALCLSGLQISEALADETAEVRSLLARGWTFLENGDMRQAEESFSAAFDTQVGRSTAETYYAIAAIWWERRNAMAAYMWLSDGVKTARESYSWDGGQGQEWDRRIGGRKRFIENNFTIAKLRAPRGKALPPLADPPPLDPVLREFADMLPRVVAEGTEAKVELQWVLLPNGSYWVGSDLQQLTGGELEPSRAVSWSLVKDSRRNRRQYERQVAAIEGGDSLALKLLKHGDLAASEAGRKEAAVAAAEEEKDRQEILREARRREAEKEFQRRAVDEEKRRKAAIEEADRRSSATSSDDAMATNSAQQGSSSSSASESSSASAASGAGSRDIATKKAADGGESRSQDPWAKAVEKMQQVQEEERREERARRTSIKGQKRRFGKSPPDLDAYLARRFYVAVGGGGAGVTRLTATGTTSEVQWQGHWEFGYVAPLQTTPVGPLGLALAFSYDNLPVSGCSQKQTRGHALALHAAPRLALHLTGRLWLQAQVGVHMGALGTWPTTTDREACASSRLESGGDAVAYGARLGSGTATARVSLEDLGWRGFAMTLGPDLLVGVSFAPRASKLYLGAQFFIRHDQVFAVLQEGTYRYRVEGQEGLNLGQQKLGALSSTASMARFQFGLRGQVSF